MGYSDRVVTETYRDKNYEEELTKAYFDAMKKMEMANFSPNLMVVRQAFSAVKSFAEAMIYSKEYLEQYEKKVKVEMDNIQTILYGDYRQMDVKRISIEYNAKIDNKNGEQILVNGQNIMKQLSEIMFLTKQWAYSEGLFLPKPIVKKHGNEGIENTLMQ